MAELMVGLLAVRTALKMVDKMVAMMADQMEHSWVVLWGNQKVAQLGFDWVASTAAKTEF